MRTSALATTAPLGSVTVPVMAPVAPPCANDSDVNARTAIEITINLAERLGIVSPRMLEILLVVSRSRMQDIEYNTGNSVRLKRASTGTFGLPRAWTTWAQTSSMPDTPFPVGLLGIAKAYRIGTPIFKSSFCGKLLVGGVRRILLCHSTEPLEPPGFQPSRFAHAFVLEAPHACGQDRRPVHIAHNFSFVRAVHDRHAPDVVLQKLRSGFGDKFVRIRGYQFPASGFNRRHRSGRI